MLTENSTDYINKNAIGYMVNASISTEGAAQIAQIQRRLIDAFGDKVWCAPVETLHITLMDWIAPLADYGQDKDELFETILPLYSNALKESLAEHKSIEVTFNTVQVSPGAVFCVGLDGGRMNRIRKTFTDKIDLIEGTKRPPTIVHTSIARFKAEIDIDNVKGVVQKYPISFTECIDSFRLIRETKLPMQEYEILQEYRLK